MRGRLAKTASCVLRNSLADAAEPEGHDGAVLAGQGLEAAVRQTCQHVEVAEDRQRPGPGGSFRTLSGRDRAVRGGRMTNAMVPRMTKIMARNSSEWNILSTTNFMCKR